MTDLYIAIKQRRSVRKYQSAVVPKGVVREALGAAGMAPSAHNAQPWRFIVLENPALKRSLAEAMADAWAEDLGKDGLKMDCKVRAEKVNRFADAPVLILACLTMDGMQKFSDARQTVERDLAVASLGAGIQNLLLTAHGRGLGACWFCAPAFCKETVRKGLSLPADVEPQAFVALGYPLEAPATPPRKMLAEYCYVDMWGKPL
jgi:coenzyme F420-0:L-glutamate ligase / coenzyme F420-1:gamma-L-glutamate ligase